MKPPEGTGREDAGSVGGVGFSGDAPAPLGVFWVEGDSKAGVPWCAFEGG